MAQQGRAFATEPNGLSLIPRSQVVEGQNGLTQILSCPLTSTLTQTHRINEYWKRVLLRNHKAYQQARSINRLHPDSFLLSVCLSVYSPSLPCPGVIIHNLVQYCQAIHLHGCLLNLIHNHHGGTWSKISRYSQLRVQETRCDTTVVTFLIVFTKYLPRTCKIYFGSISEGRWSIRAQKASQQGAPWHLSVGKWPGSRKKTEASSLATNDSPSPFGSTSWRFYSLLQNTASWGPSAQAHESAGDIRHQNIQRHMPDS